ncbi:MAG: class I SAM-dependent methyltransferase [Myxococcota bacterium]
MAAQAHWSQGAPLTTPIPTAVELRERERERLLALLDASLAEIDALVPLDEARFLETHALYEGRSDQRQRIIEWFAREITPARRRDRPFQMLSVGCGSGLLDLPILQGLSSRSAEVHYVGVNPNRVECAAFERLFRETAPQGVSVELVPATFEAFQTDLVFDHIYFVHSLYYMPDPAAALEKARKSLAPGGRLIVFHAPCEALNDLAELFWKKEHSRPTLFAEGFAKLLDRWGWNYQQSRVEGAVEVTPLLEGDTDAGLALRDFIIQFDGRSLPASVQEQVARYLRLVAFEHQGRNFISHPVDVFSIAG